jgi:hypothetical protein
VNTDRTDGDLEMQIEPTSGGSKMCTFSSYSSITNTHSDPLPAKRKRQNLEKMEARKRLREQSKMVASGASPAHVERRGMKLQEKNGLRPDAKKKNTTQARRERKEKARVKKEVEEGSRMDIE